MTETSGTFIGIQSDVPLEGWSKWVDRTGVAIGVLAVTGFVLWRLATWLRPKADRVIDGVLANNARVPELLAEHAKVNLQIADSLARLAEVQKQQVRLLEEINKRMSKRKARGGEDADF